MTAKDDAFLKQLRATFKVEAGEHLQTIAAGLLELEKTPAPDSQRKIVESVFRATHSLKGAARAVDFTEIESQCQSLEDVFASWKRKESAPSPTALDTLHRALDTITATLAATSAPPAKPRHEIVPPSPPAAERIAPEETVRVAVAKLEAQLLESEEMITAKLTAGQRAADLRKLAGEFEAWRKAWATAEPDARRLRQPRDGAPSSAGLKRLLDFFEWSLDTLKSIESKATAIGRAEDQDRHVIGKLVDDLLEDSKKLLLLPFATISGSFPKLVRDLSRDQGKEGDLTIRGEDVEIDKRILEEMKDPLVHLLRNSIDHGIETPSERARRGKPSRATITLAVARVNGNKLELLVSDDGPGIDTVRVKQSAVKHGLISAEEAGRLSEAEAQALIFHSEVSTTPIITQVSGRGLGLAIVREKAEKLGGEVSVEGGPRRETN